MIEFISIIAAMIIGFSAGYNKKANKLEKMITDLMIEIQEKNEYFTAVENILKDENENISMILRYLEKNRGTDEEAETALHRLEMILEDLDEAKKHQHITGQAREKIREMVKAERKDPFLARIGKKFIHWL